ncbi:hypothetical protein [Actinomadura chibensis]|uniref:Uncharacterized protein n=1 Tax=Actinomadura chibensis TaxID=392828 RepID=A0A5D0N1R1_9ACTN|nr:hypothetical protein [Actinomadura chibensis]TYB38410.1 hypothetical protein FXF69_41465 [Actinomadura chibensis]
MNSHSDSFTAPFWVDEDYDRQNASDGVSRYGAYVRDRLDIAFAECWDDGDESSIRLAEFAAAAWRTATGPVMVPGYVRHKSRVLGVRVERSNWDGSLIATVSLVAPWPAELAHSSGWQRGPRWRDWPTELRGKGYDFVHPSEKDVTESPFLQASLAVTFPVTLDRMPEAPADPRDDVVGRAQLTVQVLAAELNHIVRPVLDVLDGRWPR